MRQFVFRSCLIAAIISTLFIFAGCSTTPEKQDPQAEINAHLQAAAQTMNTVNANLVLLNPAIQTAGAVGAIVSPQNALAIEAGVAATTKINEAISAVAVANAAAKKASLPAILPVPEIATPTPNICENILKKMLIGCAIFVIGTGIFTAARLHSCPNTMGLFRAV